MAFGAFFLKSKRYCWLEAGLLLCCIRCYACESLRQRKSYNL